MTKTSPDNLKPEPSSLKVLRAAFNLTQEELAKIAGCSRTTIVALEQKKALPTLKTAQKIADALHVENVSEIFPVYSNLDGAK